MQDKTEALFRKYIEPKRVLIVDPCVAMRAGLGRTLVDMGAKQAQVKLCGDFDSAATLIPTFKPDIVLCEYDIGGRCGLDLLQGQRKAHPESKKSVFILVTANTSQSAVAQAAEEDIDNYIVKPYTIDMLRQSIMRTALAKDYPSDYVRTVEEGKNVLLSGNPEAAMAVFEKAMKMDPKPTLACFYYGQAYLLKQALDQAQGSYNKGLAYNRIHYKCLTGLFDVLMMKGMFQGAYDVVKRIARYFPANPQRLTSVLRLAVMTNSFEDIERYYRVFTGIDERNEELIRYICAALVVCGKFYLRRDFKSRALVLFEKASMYAADRPHILREIMLSLIAHGLVKEANAFLTRFSASSRESSEFISCKFVLDDQQMTALASIQEGERLLERGIQFPEIYEILIRRCMETEQAERAASFAKAAGEAWPEKREDFSKLTLPKDAQAKPKS